MAPDVPSPGDRPGSRYDALLVGVPLAFLVTYLTGAALLHSTVLPLLAGGLASGVLVADGLFVHAPGE